MSALLRSGQEASEPAAYFYTCMRSGPGRAIVLVRSVSAASLHVKEAGKREEAGCSWTPQLQRRRR